MALLFLIARVQALWFSYDSPDMATIEPMMMPVQEVRRPTIRVMYSGVSTYCTCGGVVIPAYAGIQAALRSWIPAYAGMTFLLSIHAPGSLFNMHNML
jgi:hypothetical protein